MSAVPPLAATPVPFPEVWPAAGELVALRTTYLGWNAWLLGNEYVRLVAVPDIGGRIVALELRGAPNPDANPNADPDADPDADAAGDAADHNFIWMDPHLAGKLFSHEENQGDGSLGAWKNYGGDKTWPAPQGWERDDQWHGPPDAVLDTGRYRVDDFGIKGNGNGAGNGTGSGAGTGSRVARLRMVSPPDPRTGIQISRCFSLSPGATRIELLLTFHNASLNPVRWSIWDVIQLNAQRAVSEDEAAASGSAVGGYDYDPTCVVTAPVTPSSEAGEAPYHVMFGAPDNPQWSVEDGLFLARYQWKIGKVGIRSPGGWVAFNQGSRSATFVERFAVDPAGVYPDGGATVECWTVGEGAVGNLSYEGSGIYHMEAEVLSPLHTMAPGQEARFAVTWGLCRCAGAVLHAEDGGCSVQRLSATRTGTEVRLQGRFGLFEQGRLEVEWIDAHSRRVGGRPLDCSGEPLHELALDVTLPAPPTATDAEIWLRSAGTSRRLDSCKLPAAP